MTIKPPIASRPFLVFETPSPQTLSARFIYNYYEPDEYVNTPIVPSDIPGPRRIELTFQKAEDILQLNDIGNYMNSNIAHFVDQLSTKLTSETMLQSTGFMKYTSDTMREFHYVEASQLNSGAQINSTDAFFENASTVQGRDFASTPDSSTVYLNPSTNRPSSLAADSTAEFANESFLAADVCFDLLEASAANPFSIHSRSNSSGLRDVKLLQAKTRRSINPTLYSSNNFNAFVDYLDLHPSVASGLGDSYGLGIIGYMLFKKEVDESGNVVEHYPSQLLLNMSQQTFSDNAIKYGHRYEYSLHPLMVIRQPPSDGGAYASSFVMVGSRSKICRILAVENVPPPPVEAIQFRYLGNGQVSLLWSPPAQYGEVSNKVIGDIKGYQIFTRKNINHPFSLDKYITFNDMIGLENFPLQEFVPENRIRRTNHHTTDHTIYLDRDVNYIFGMCTIDAHGNSSNLSPQYYVRLDSYTNSLRVDFASFKGAPKQYPNLMMSKKVFLDSFKVSDKGKLTVYFCPKYTHIHVGQSTELETATPVLSDSSSDNPSYRLQIINVDKQEDKVLDIFLED